MGKKYLIECTITDMETGEISQKQEYSNVNPLEEYKSTEQFSMIYLNGVSLLTQRLSKLALLVAWYMSLSMEYDNYLYKSQKDLAVFFNESPGNISSVIKELVQVNFCLKAKTKTGNSMFLINPQFSYRGKRRDRAFVIYAKYKEMCDSTKSQVKRSPIHKTKSFKDFQFENSTISTLIAYLLSKFKDSKVMVQTIDDITKDTQISRVTVTKFLQYLQYRGCILRKRGKIQLLIPLEELADKVS